LSGGPGSDQIDGGLGIDFAVFDAGRSAHGLSRNSPGEAIVVTDNISGDTDTLVAVERLQFADQRLAMDLAIGENGADVAMFLGTLAFDLRNDPGIFGAVLGIADAGPDLNGLFQFAGDMGLIHSLVSCPGNT
jgi:hypothetical protein